MGEEHGRGLCHRCEHRARALETGGGPRWECGNFGEAVTSCYMYLPVLPAIMERHENDDREIRWPAFARARSRYVGVVDTGMVKPVIQRVGGGYTILWEKVGGADQARTAWDRLKAALRRYLMLWNAG